MVVLVTGASGFIGSYVIPQLLSKGIKVIATDRDINKAMQHEWYKNVEFIECNIGNVSEKNLILFSQATKLIHLAWEGLPNYKELFHFEKNLLIQYNFIKQIIGVGIQDITISGTCFEYGMREGGLSVDMNPNPQNSYALAKDTLRRFLQELQKYETFKLKWVRLFYTYGKGQSGNSLLSQLEKAMLNNEKVFNLSGGEQLRDYLHVYDLAAQLVEFSLNNSLNGIFNCCSGKPISIKKLVQDYVAMHNSGIRLNFGYYPYLDYEPMAFWGIK